MNSVASSALARKSSKMLVCRLVGVVLLPLVELELVGAAVGADVVLLPPDAVGVAVGAAVGAVGAAVGATDVITLCGTAMAKVVVWAGSIKMQYLVHSLSRLPHSCEIICFCLAPA